MLEQWFKTMMAVWLLQERQKELLIMRLADELRSETGDDSKVLKVIQDFMSQVR